MKSWIGIIGVLLAVFELLPTNAQERIKPPFYTTESTIWADSVIQTMTIEEKIGQMIMMAAWSNKDSSHINYLRQIITEYHIGGLIFFQGGPMRQALLTNDYQKISKVPLLIGIDGEWGLSMRLDSTIRFPRQMTLAANESAGEMVYKVGKNIGQQCNRMGIHINFAPVVDINTNAANPIISTRSFGDNPQTVSANGIAYMNALHEQKILSCAKHFPGHGNTNQDSHHTLPLISASKEALDSVELYPFRQLIDSGLGSLMVGHLSVTAYDSLANHPSTLSKEIVTALLRNRLNFSGIIFTDALNMKGVSNFFTSGEIEKLAFLAGNDIFLYSESPFQTIKALKQAMADSLITETAINNSVRKILCWKYWAGLHNYTPIDTLHLLSDLNATEIKLLQEDAYHQSITMLKNDGMVPMNEVNTKRTISIALADIKHNVFQSRLNDYANIDCFALAKDDEQMLYESLLNFCDNYDRVILSIHNTSTKADKNYGINENQIAFIDSVIKRHQTMVVVFGNSYVLGTVPGLPNARGILIAYEDFAVTQDLAAQAIMGGRTISGKLPVAVNDFFKRGQQIRQDSVIRFAYSLPEKLGIKSSELDSLSIIIAGAIAQKAMPGCQLLVAKDGIVIYNQSFGYTTYEDSLLVNNHTVYDLASLTKILATAPSIMHLYERRQVNLEHQLGKYLAGSRYKPIANVKISDMLYHQAGFKAWVPFYKEKIIEPNKALEFFSDTITSRHTLAIAQNLYGINSLKDSVFQWICEQKIGSDHQYIYSDFGPILLGRLVEQVTNTTLSNYVQSNFYGPLGLSKLGYAPLRQFSKRQIAPTSFDSIFRKQLIHGYTHDPAAALMGGEAGNAGLFSNANDVAIIMQMLMQGGHYGGTQYFLPNTVTYFTSKQIDSKNRRGLLFDKPNPEDPQLSPAAAGCSNSTFGHQGFTGTCAWADPENRLVFVFLSNRVHPNESNTLLSKLNIRTELHQVVYNAIKPIR
jgi:beta-N-acetylhexosaminidase